MPVSSGKDKTNINVSCDNTVVLHKKDGFALRVNSSIMKGYRSLNVQCKCPVVMRQNGSQQVNL